MLITQLEIFTLNLCTLTVKLCYQAHSKDIYSLLNDYPGTINFCNYTYDQVLQNDQQFYENTLLYPGYNKKLMFGYVKYR